jgi:hypothetical protein
MCGDDNQAYVILFTFFFAKEHLIRRLGEREKKQACRNRDKVVGLVS